MVYILQKKNDTVATDVEIRKLQSTSASRCDSNPLHPKFKEDIDQACEIVYNLKHLGGCESKGLNPSRRVKLIAPGSSK